MTPFLLFCVVMCGPSFFLGPVTLQNYTILSVLNGARDVIITMEDTNNTASPFPSSFSWTFNGKPAINSSLVTLGYPAVTFHMVEPSHNGLYSLSATNHFTNYTKRVPSKGLGTFTLEVICKFIS